MINKPQAWLLGLGLATAMMTVSQTAQAAMINLAATLDQAQEVPTPPTLVPGASGLANMTYDTISNLLSWNIIFGGLSGPVTGFHFHGPAAPGATAPVTVNIGNISGFNSPAVGSIPITEVQEEQLLSGLWYINIHTAQNPSGEIRGQVYTVPEPSNWGFLALAGVSFLCYKLRQKSSV